MMILDLGNGEDDSSVSEEELFRIEEDGRSELRTECRRDGLVDLECVQYP
jgi:hypothetical protein